MCVCMPPPPFFLLPFLLSASFSSFFSSPLPFSLSFLLEQLFSFSFYTSIPIYFPESSTPDQLSGKSWVKIQVWAFFAFPQSFLLHTLPSFSFLLFFSPPPPPFFPSIFSLDPLPCLSPWVCSYKATFLLHSWLHCLLFN